MNFGFQPTPAAGGFGAGPAGQTFNAAAGQWMPASQIQQPLDLQRPTGAPGFSGNAAASPASGPQPYTAAPPPAPAQAPMQVGGGLSQAPMGSAGTPSAELSIGGNSGGPSTGEIGANMLKSAGDSLKNSTHGMDPYAMVFSHHNDPVQQTPAIAPIQAPSLNSMTSMSDRATKRRIKPAQSETAAFLDAIFASFGGDS